MTKSRSMAKSQNRGDGCSKMRFMTCENGGAAPWSDLDHHLLYLVIMKLEVFDFRAFGEVCKSWRSLALSNKTEFMASRPPMAISISKRSNKKVYWLEDSEGRKSKMPLPQSDGRTCVGLTCGYLVLFGRRTRDFWLVNPITRHALHFPKRHGDQFPKVPQYLDREGDRAILVFSYSVSTWVFVFLCRYKSRIWYSIAGTGTWNYVYSEVPTRDLHEFKGKIYTIDADCFLYELRLDPEPKLTFLDTKNYPESKHRYMPPLFVELVSSGEKLYAMECFSEDSYEVHELDFGEMKWVSPEEKTMEEHAFCVSKLKHSALIKRELLPDSWSLYKKHAYRGNKMFFMADIWYFSHGCMKVKSHA